MTIKHQTQTVADTSTGVCIAMILDRPADEATKGFCEMGATFRRWRKKDAIVKVHLQPYF